MVFSPLTVALFQLCSHSDAIPKALLPQCPSRGSRAGLPDPAAGGWDGHSAWSTASLSCLSSCWTHADRNAEFPSFLSKFSSRRQPTLAQAGGGGDRGAFISHLESCAGFKRARRAGVGDVWRLAGQRGTVGLERFPCASVGGCAEPQRALLVERGAGGAAGAQRRCPCSPGPPRPPALTPASLHIPRVSHWLPFSWFHPVVNINSILEIGEGDAGAWSNALKMM